MGERESISFAEKIQELRIEHAQNRLAQDIAERSFTALNPDGTLRPLIERLQMLDGISSLARDIADRIARGEKLDLRDTNGRPISNGLHTQGEYFRMMGKI
ncbi:hypothetical protein HYU92_01695 [Candidatus Curtissbacteria bacterium]|nr:hypothetical protein [Candidatus Curtissbacteria bacterium]